MKRKQLLICILAVIVIMMLVFRKNTNNHTFTLTYSEDEGILEQIQPLSNLIKVRSEADTSVIFTDMETGQEYEIGYLTPGITEKITLQKGNWYTVQAYGNLIVQQVDVRKNF